jgi:DNA modification methylase
MEQIKKTIGNATIYLGDCKDILHQVGLVDAVVTDPPYGIKRFEKPSGKTRFQGVMEKKGLIWDTKPNQEIFNLMLTISKNQIIWGANNFNLPASEYFLVWDKKQTVKNFASAELAYTNIKTPAKVFRMSIHEHNKIQKSHPTQKPIALMDWCLSFLPKAELILDPFMGSGTTGVACINHNKRFIGIEKDEKYFRIACERIRKAGNQTVMSFDKQTYQQTDFLNESA